MAETFNDMAQELGKSFKKTENLLKEVSFKNVEIEKSEMKYRMIFENVTDAIFINDLSDGSILDVNQTMLDLYGFSSKDEVLALNIGDISLNQPPYTQNEVLYFLRKAVEEGPQMFEWLARKKDSSLFWVEVHCRVAMIKDSKELLVLVRDINQRKVAETKLAQNESRLSTLISNLPGVVYTCRNDECRTIEFISAGSEALFGYSANDLVNNFKLKFCDVISQSDKARVISEIQKALGEKVPFECVYQIVTAEKDKKWVMERGRAAHFAEGKPVLVEGFITDITEWKKAENELRNLKDDLEGEVSKKTKELLNVHTKLIQSEHLAAMGQLGSTVAHEFRNQLGVIRNAAFFIKLKVKDADEKVLKHLQIFLHKSSL